jgi:pyridoxamine 5'-phosphate oxidase
MTGNKQIEQLRHKYVKEGLSEKNIPENPFKLFSGWFNEAQELGLLSANAMMLATASPDGKPSARIVLLKSFDENGFVFYTNYKSRKAGELEKNPYAALLLFWEELRHQVRIEGKVVKISKEESEKYFQTRPYESRLSAWASAQSSVIPDRETLEKKLQEYKKNFAGSVPLPDFWGGYCLEPDSIEFWQGRENRLHDRLKYTRAGKGWKMERLAP